MLEETRVRKAIAELKNYAENVGVDYYDAVALARDWWTNGQTTGHNDWSLLSEHTKEMWSMIAQFAMNEIETGQPTPSE